MYAVDVVEYLVAYHEDDLSDKDIPMSKSYLVVEYNKLVLKSNKRKQRIQELKGIIKEKYEELIKQEARLKRLRHDAQSNTEVIDALLQHEEELEERVKHEKNEKEKLFSKVEQITDDVSAKTELIKLKDQEIELLKMKILLGLLALNNVV